MTQAANKAARSVMNLQTDVTNDASMLLKHPHDYFAYIRSCDDDDTRTTDAHYTKGLAGQPWITDKEIQLLQTLGRHSGHLAGEDAVVMDRWAQHKIVYTVDPDAADAIINTDWHNTAIPADILRAIPHPDPFVALPAPIHIPHDSGGYEQYEGFIITGVRRKPGAPESRVRSSTTHPANSELCLHYYARLVDANKNPVTEYVTDIFGRRRKAHPIIGMRILTPLVDATMDERYDYALADVRNNPTGDEGWADDTITTTAIDTLVTTGLALTVYLCSDNPDTATTGIRARPRTHKTRRDQPNAPITVTGLGYRIGAALRDHKHRRSSQPHTSATGTRTVAAHVRRSHIHTYRVGPGRRRTILKWLPPIGVGLTRRPDIPQVHHAK